MIRFERYKNHGVRACTCCTHENEQKTIQGLAYTPSQMADMAARGMPVNNLNSQNYYDGSPNASYHVGAERERGVEVADLWEKHKMLSQRASEAVKQKKLNSKKE